MDSNQSDDEDGYDSLTAYNFQAYFRKRTFGSFRERKTQNEAQLVKIFNFVRPIMQVSLCIGYAQFLKLCCC